MKPRFIISGGGTGGHIFPAVAIANALKAKHPDAEFLFVGALGKMEMEKVPKAGYIIEGLPVAGFHRGAIWKNLGFPVKLLKSMLKAKKIVKSFKPHAAIGTGGFASGPILKAAGSAGVPTFVQEQNAFPGVTNRLLSKTAKKVFTAYPNMQSFFPGVSIADLGNPIRKELFDGQLNRAEAIEHFGLNPEKKTILAIGGSLGAQSMNNALAMGIQKLIEQDIQLIWQCGKHGEEMAKQSAEKYPEHIVATPFISEMAVAYSAADLVLSRAGAIAVSEIAALGKPSILIPFPHAAGDHQTKNAEAMVKDNAARMVADAQASEELILEALQLLQDGESLRQIGQMAMQKGKPNAADAIASTILQNLAL